MPEKKRFVAMELVHPRFYHLDTCFLPLDDRSALYYPGAFDSYGRKVIRRFIENPVPVGTADAYQFCLQRFSASAKRWGSPQ